MFFEMILLGHLTALFDTPATAMASHWFHCCLIGSGQSPPGPFEAQPRFDLAAAGR
jgi:hypothetical protein